MNKKPGLILIGALFVHLILSACATSKTQIVSVQPVPNKICYSLKASFGFYLATPKRTDSSNLEVNYNGMKIYAGARPLMATSNIMSVAVDIQPVPPLSEIENGALMSLVPRAPSVTQESRQVLVFRVMEPARAALSGATFQHKDDFIVVRSENETLAAIPITYQVDRENFIWIPRVDQSHLFEKICDL